MLRLLPNGVGVATNSATGGALSARSTTCRMLGPQSHNYRYRTTSESGVSAVMHCQLPIRLSLPLAVRPRNTPFESRHWNLAIGWYNVTSRR